eukprot:CFRG1757T1
MSTKESADSVVAFQLLDMLRGYQKSQALYVAAKLKVPDLLVDGPKSIDVIARECGANTVYLYRLLRTLTSMGVFIESDNKMFENSPISARLATDGGMYHLCLTWMETHYQPFGKLLEVVKQGTNGVQLCYGMEYFDWLKERDEDREIFTRAMEDISRSVRPVVVKAFDVSKVNRTADSAVTVVDVGGANGSLSCAFIKNLPKWNVVVFDLPATVGAANEYATKQGLSDRVTAQGGDFFKSVPSGDVYLLAYILHDWNDDECIRILKNIHSAMMEDGYLIIVECVLTGGYGFEESKMMDLTMLGLVSGAERTVDEYSSLFKRSGFMLTDVTVVSPSPYSIIYAKKA